MSDIKKLDLKRLFLNTFRYTKRHAHESALFSIINAIFMIIGFKICGWQDKFFLIWLIPYYIFWYAFFRFYFERKPYILNSKIFGTLLPSVQMFFLLLVIATVLSVLPIVIPFISGNEIWVENYLEELQKYEDSSMLNLAVIPVLILAAPFIFFRPMMAWIASVIGRSAKLSTAFARTKGNYWEFLLLSVIFNLSFMGLDWADKIFNLDGWLVISLVSPLTVFTNIMLAKTYEYFFLEIER
ncbi:MAG: hypothetical protein IJ689_01900 [Alphaproteobacteria bacterium]|nr:hypothetical protein [Alphaproteobacteria bacterium]